LVARIVGVRVCAWICSSGGTMFASRLAGRWSNFFFAVVADRWHQHPLARHQQRENNAARAAASAKRMALWRCGNMKRREAAGENKERKDGGISVTVFMLCRHRKLSASGVAWPVIFAAIGSVDLPVAGAANGESGEKRKR